jgi:phenylalanyl-tRNA synthetase beta chain
MTLVARGYDEARTSKLLSRTATRSAESTKRDLSTSLDMTNTGIVFCEGAIQLKNPLSEDHVALRPSLVPGLLGVLSRNVRSGAERVTMFEIGRVFLPPGGKEERRLGILVWGNVASSPNWRAQTKRQLDFFDLKGAIDALGIPRLSFRRSEHRDLALATEIWSGDRVVGLAGHLATSRTSDSTAAVFVVEVHVDVVLEARRSAKSFREIDRFPSVTRDIAMIVPDKISHAEILRAIEEPKEPLLESVQLFDLFTGDVGAARKSLAYTLTYRDRSRTLTSEEVTAAHAKIRERLRRELGAELRE